MDKPAIDVAYVAELARLDLTDDEKAVFQPQLENIVKYVEKISSVDVDGVPPTLHGHAVVNALREDEVRPSMDREEALANAPGRTGDEFLLPKIVEGFLEKVRLEDPKYVFLVVTYGTSPGACRAIATKILSKNRIKLDAAYSIRMPDTWTPSFDLSDPEFVAD